MKQRTLALLTTGILSALLCSAPGFAGDFSAGKEASGEAPRAMGSASEFKGAKAKPVPGIQADRSSTRDVLLDDAAIAKAYTIIGRSATAVTSSWRRAVRSSTRSRMPRRAASARKVEGGGGRPRRLRFARHRRQGQSRADHQFDGLSVHHGVGYLQMGDKKGEVWSCTAALIGPKTAITAANCLYNHAEEGGWRDKVVFWPAVNGENNAPYGGFDYDTEYVFQAYVTDYDGTYDGIGSTTSGSSPSRIDRQFAGMAGLQRRRYRRFPGHRHRLPR